MPKPRARFLQSLLSSLCVIVVEPRFPENIGMIARACANMGLGGDIPDSSGADPFSCLRLIAPERWNREKALPLATAQGMPILDSMRVYDTFSEAVSDAALVIATTARTGGWRKGILPPDRAARLAIRALSENQRVALVFGREDRGLDNRTIAQCTHIVHLPVCPRATSLNVAQAALLMLYECRKAAGDARPSASRPALKPSLTQAERERFFSALQESLLAIDALPAENPDYFMLPLRRFFNHAPMAREDFDRFMGICRQIKWLANASAQKQKER